jgi:hypothetical protein
MTYAGGRLLDRGTDGRDVELRRSSPPRPRRRPPRRSPSSCPRRSHERLHRHPVWPAALLADQTPTSMVGAQFMLASW